MNIECRFFESAGKVQRYLRRYYWPDGASCAAKGPGYGHNAMVLIDTVPGDRTTHTSGDLWDHADPRWPSACICGYVFEETNDWQLYHSPLWICKATGLEVEFNDLPVGAMWYADWQGIYNGMGIGPDGHTLNVRTPGGDWNVDSRANNCTLPNDNEHRCWVRHGEVPKITVDKNGPTCAAGAGSILCGSYHGFLRDGYLTE